jgi:hypothetical protein
MEDEIRFAGPRLVVDNKGERLFTRSFAASRKRRQISVHREWNEHTEWWVGHVVADGEVYRIGVFTNPERAFAATIAYYYEIVARLQQEERLASEPAVAAAAATTAARAGQRATASASATPARGRLPVRDTPARGEVAADAVPPIAKRAARTGARSGSDLEN